MSVDASVPGEHILLLILCSPPENCPSLRTSPWWRASRTSPSRPDQVKSARHHRGPKTLCRGLRAYSRSPSTTLSQKLRLFPFFSNPSAKPSPITQSTRRPHLRNSIAVRTGARSVPWHAGPGRASPRRRGARGLLSVESTKAPRNLISAPLLAEDGLQELRCIL